MQILIPVLLFAAALQPYDIVIRNGHIVDGAGSPWYADDIGIRAGRIAAIGRLEANPARRTIDAHGMVVAPGFIDMLGQSELTILVNPHLPSKIYQGITTEITGEGDSVAPLNDAAKTEELIALAAEAAPRGGVYASHIRDEGNGILPGPSWLCQRL